MPSVRKFSSQLLNSKAAFWGLWLLAAILLVPTFAQILNLILYVALLIINNPALRPTGWSTPTLNGVSRCGLLILGSLWLGLVVYLEGYLSEGWAEGQLPARGGRVLLSIAATYLLSALILFLIS